MAQSGRACVDLYWLPLGAGGSPLVRSSGRAFEAVVAAGENRERRDLYHSALEVVLDGERYVVESAPAWGNRDRDRGVVAEGPVGLRVLGRSRYFRYEVRRWRGGVLPDRGYAVDSPRRLSLDRRHARRVLEAVARVPTPTWGRDELGAGEMWNSNSLIAWVLVTSGHVTSAISPPPHGRAPGWTAGLVTASRTGVRAGVLPVSAAAR